MVRNRMSLTLANDLGYGFAKMCFNGKDHYKVPSEKAFKRPMAADQSQGSFINRANLDRYVENYMDHMDTTIDSKGLRNDNKQENLVGQAAVSSNRHLQAFNVSDSSGKASTDLALIITLSSIAGYALSKYYAANKKIPKTLHVSVKMATALPIVEGSKPNVKSKYKERYMAAPHMVTIDNFSHPVSVDIKFTQVFILLEGQAAQFAIWSSRPDPKSRKTMVPHMMKSIEQDFDKYDADKMDTNEPIDPNYLVSAKMNVLGIDIGEGTTDYAVFNGSRVNTQASNSSNTGYGNLLNEALLELQRNGFGVSDRGHLKQILDEPVNPFNKGKKDRIKQTMSHYVNGFINDMISHLSIAIRTAQNNIDLIYVYGGGSIPLAQALRKPLLEETKRFNSGKIIPVIVINQRWAQDMNEIGLQLLLTFE